MEQSYSMHTGGIYRRQGDRIQLDQTPTPAGGWDAKCMGRAFSARRMGAHASPGVRLGQACWRAFSPLWSYPCKVQG